MKKQGHLQCPSQPKSRDSSLFRRNVTNRAHSIGTVGVLIPNMIISRLTRHQSSTSPSVLLAAPFGDATATSEGQAVPSPAKARTGSTAAAEVGMCEEVVVRRRR